MAYDVHFQTYAPYKKVKYGQGTVYSSGCGCAALCNALDVLGIAKITVKDMCAYSVSVGARVEGGTDEQCLLRNACKKWAFEYKTTSKNAELLKHLQSGGVAILHGGSSHKLFSSGGHFVCAVKASGETITVLDSYWYSNKYTSTALRQQKVKVLYDGVITTSLYQCGLATADRSPSYYLISKKTVQKPTTDTKKEETTTPTPAKEDDDEVKYQKYENVPEWGKTAVKYVMDKGYMSGTGNGNIDLTESMLRMIVILYNAGVFGNKEE